MEAGWNKEGHLDWSTGRIPRSVMSCQVLGSGGFDLKMCRQEGGKGVAAGVGQAAGHLAWKLQGYERTRSCNAGHKIVQLCLFIQHTIV
jgi:hypothetical protein